jgi:hypothetical protein
MKELLSITNEKFLITKIDRKQQFFSNGHLHIPQLFQSICIPQTSQPFDASNSQLKIISTIQLIYMKYIRFKILYNPLI